MKGRAGDVEQIEQERDCQQSPGGSLSHPQQAGQRRPAINSQAAHADSNRRTFDHKTTGWVLVAQAREETADEERENRVAARQERCRQRAQGQSKDDQGTLSFQQVIAPSCFYPAPQF
jgi:hypothetical protein